jgi:FMN-dependent NADH-azoreductase
MLFHSSANHNQSKTMPTLLLLDASPRGDLSISRQLSKAAVAAWKDKHPVRGGKTFNYLATGPEGLTKGRKVLVAVASGGSYDKASGTMRIAQGQVSSEEFMAPLLKQIKAAV